MKGERNNARAALFTFHLSLFTLCGCTVHLHVFENVKLPELPERKPAATQPAPREAKSGVPSPSPLMITIDRMLKGAADAAWGKSNESGK